MSNVPAKALFTLLLTLSDEELSALIDSLAKVKEIIETFVKFILPTTLNIHGRTFKVLGFLQGDEECVDGYTMVKRARKLKANLGMKEGKYLLKHQAGIPAQLRGNDVFVFTDWRHPDDSERVAFVIWGNGRWIRSWGRLSDNWGVDSCFLRRVK